VRNKQVVFQSTIDALAEKIGVTLNASRFRPNIVLHSETTSIMPFQEFDWIGEELVHNDATNSLRLRIVNKTVRCEGIGVDSLDPTVRLDLPALLMEHFPDQGPFLGVYCTLEGPGQLSIGDELRLKQLN
jgi:uncharacterized protein YcbX